MVTNSFKQPFLHLTREVLKHLLPISGYVLVFSWLDLRYHLEDFNFPVPIVAVLGTVIGLLLAFRTNSSYARWWEARTLWGAIVNDSRTWVRQLLEFCKQEDASVVADTQLRRMAYRQIAWCYSLSRSLRGQEPTQDVQTLLDATEIETYRSCQHVPNEILLRQAAELRQLYDARRLELFQFVELEKTLTRLTDSMGGCERIRNTPFPVSYSRLVDTSIYVFVLFLPLGLVNVPPSALIFTSLAFAILFLMIERVAIFLQDPFSSRPSDTPVLSLSRTVEINIKQMLREEDLPAKLEPVDGVLY